MNKFIIVAVVIAGFALLFGAGKPASERPLKSVENETVEQSSLSIIGEQSFDFGTISMKKGDVSRVFTVENKGESPVTIKRVTTSCMCTEAFFVEGTERFGPFGMPGHGSVPLLNKIIPAKSQRDIEVVFDPSAHGPAGIGKIERAVFIEDGTGGVKTITIKAVVIP